jgi:DNA-binding winged helix-turn-helix (wHTH) protein
MSDRDAQADRPDTMTNILAVVRYRFSHFVVSPRRRLLARGGREVPLIPRYFDLLVLLIERRHEAVHRRDIFDRVWTDVIVSDSALSQAIRTIRRTLEDDSREPRFIRTVSRHGYRFVYPDVIEEPDDDAWPAVKEDLGVARERPTTVETDPFEPLLARISSSSLGDEERLEAAELLHALGTAEAVQRLGTRNGHERARALLRDSRWDVPGAGDVPVLGAPGAVTVAQELVALRLRRAARSVAGRWAGGALGAAVAGAVAGAAGAVLLAAVPEGRATAGLIPVLAAIGALTAGLGGAGVAAGLGVAEAVARSRRAISIILASSIGGAIVGGLAQSLGRLSLATLVGVRVEIGGMLEGIVIGATVGAGYALATRHSEGGLAAPRGRRRVLAAALIGVMCGVAGVVLTLAGRPLVGGTLHAIARHAEGSEVTLTPLGKLLGEPDFGPITQALLGFGEAGLFGFGCAFGLLRRPRRKNGSTNGERQTQPGSEKDPT